MSIGFAYCTNTFSISHKETKHTKRKKLQIDNLPAFLAIGCRGFRTAIFDSLLATTDFMDE
jgi:hypothetical protein